MEMSLREGGTVSAENLDCVGFDSILDSQVQEMPAESRSERHLSLHRYFLFCLAS